MKIKLKDITTRRTYQGGIVCSAYVCGEYMRHQYMGYNMTQAKKLFQEVANKATEYGERWIYCSIFRGF